MLEMIVAMVASAFLLAGLGSVMYIAREVAYAPIAADHRSKAADVVNQISDELRYATYITQQTSQVLEFVVADRNNDGTSEKIRYEWSGNPGDSLKKTVNGGTPVDVLTSVYAFAVTLQQAAKTTTLTTTTDSAETVLLANTAVITGKFRDIDTSNFEGMHIYPSSFSGVPSNATSWNCTKIDFHGKQGGAATSTLTVQIRPSGDPNDTPTTVPLGQATMAESLISNAGSGAFNTITFPSPIRNLTFSRAYDIVFLEQSGSGKALSLTYDDSVPAGVVETSDAGATWQYVSTRQLFGRVYGTYTTPGTSYNVTHNLVSYVRLALQAGGQSTARIDTSIPTRNSPELLANYWRTDFDRNPTATNANGDTTADWAVTGGGTFDTNKLSNGIWTATGAIETRPLSDFTTTTTVEFSCRNTSVGGNGAVLAIFVDRQGGQYAPLLVYVQKQADGTQTLSLNGRTADTVVKNLFTRSRLSSGFVRVKLTALPQYHLVNLRINGEDQGTYTYPRYAPTGTTDRICTVYADTSSAEFDYVDIRAGLN